MSIFNIIETSQKLGENMKKKKLIIIIILVIIGIILFIFMKKSNIISTFQDDFIFFKIFSNTNKNNQITSDIEHFEGETYIFDVKYNNLQMKNVNLTNTINPKTLVKELIAPGTEGFFNVILKSNKNSKYRIRFVSKNTKPKNLIFYIENDDTKYSSLEELEKVLVGNIKANKQKNIRINWRWEYSTNNIDDFEDTKDGKNINKYNFDIYVIGEE